MTPARSMAASVVALGFAGSLTAPPPAHAAPGCVRPEHYAAQSGAELLRIDRLDLGPMARIANRGADSGTGDEGAAPTHSDRSRSPGSSASGDSAGDDGAHRARTLPAPVPSDGARGSGGGARGSGDGAPGSDDGGSGSGGAVSGDDGAGDGGQGGGSGGSRAIRGAGQPGAIRGEAGAGAIRGEGAPRAIGDVGLGDSRSVLLAEAPVNSAGAARILDGKVAGSANRTEMVVQQAPPVKPKAEARRTGARKYGPVQVGAGVLNARAVWADGMGCGATSGEASSASAEISRITVTGGGSGALVRVPEKISSRSGTALRQRAGVPQTVASATVTAGRISLVDNEVRIRVLRAPQLRVSMTAGGAGAVDYQPAVVEVTSKGGKRARLDTAGKHVEITLSEDLRPLESTPARLEPAGKLPLPTVPGLPSPGTPESSPAPADTPGSTLRISLGDVRQATDGAAIAAAATAIRVTVVRNDARTAGKPSGVVADLAIGMLEAAAVAPGGNRSTLGTQPGTGGTASPGLPITGPRVVSLLFAGAALVLGGAGAVVMTSRRRRNEP